MTPIEIAAQAFTSLTDAERENWPAFKGEAREIFRALEAAGYRIVGPEPTEDFLRKPPIRLTQPRDFWKAAHEVVYRAAPRWTEDE